jgi:hypothetical protein
MGADSDPIQMGLGPLSATFRTLSVLKYPQLPTPWKVTGGS